MLLTTCMTLGVKCSSMCVHCKLCEGSYSKLHVAYLTWIVKQGKLKLCWDANTVS